MNKKCIVCGNEFTPKNKTNKMCSNTCKFKSQVGKRTKKEKLSCGYCGKAINRIPSRVLSEVVYCSVQCRNKRNLIHIYTCKNCNREFHGGTSQTKFCSKDCYTQFQIKNTKAKPNCECFICKKIFYVNPKRIRERGEGKYCSKECHSIGMTGLVKNGVPVKHYHNQQWNIARKKAMERDGYKCVVCERTDRLSVNHMFPRTWGGTDDLDNLETLCNSCHPKVDLQRIKEITGIECIRLTDIPKLI